MKEQEKIEIGNKKVLVSSPYTPKEQYSQKFIGRESEMKLIIAAWLARKTSIPLSPLLVGKPGGGKNRLVYELAKRTSRKLYIFQGHEDVTAEDLACAVRFSDTDKNQMDYVASPLVTAMINGGICFIDEIGKIRPRALALLVSVLDERRYIDSTLLGERIEAKAEFRFIAATNTGEIQRLPEFIQSRMRPVIQIDYPRENEINYIIKANHSDHNQIELERLLEKFWSLWQGHFTKEEEKPSPRDAIYLFALASSMSDYALRENSELVKEVKREGVNPLYDIDPINYTSEISSDILEEAFEELFVKEKK
jgi:MoxR-like ATPase